MKINPKDYGSSKLRLNALNQLWEFGRELKVYLKRVLYGLDRDCDRRNYFIGTQVYQDNDAIVVEDGYNGFFEYEGDMPKPSYPISGSRTFPGLKFAVNVATKYQVGGDWTHPVVVANQTTGDHADSVYEDGTSLQLFYYDDDSYSFSGSYAGQLLTETLTNDAIASFTPSAPNNTWNANPSYVWLRPNFGPRNSVWITANVQSSEFNSVFDTKGVPPLSVVDGYKPNWFTYYNDAAASDATLTINLPIKSGITASDYTCAIKVYEANANGRESVTRNIGHVHTVQSAGTELPTSISFTKDDVLNGNSGSIEHPLIIEISSLVRP